MTTAALGLSVALAWASWRWFEAPLLRFGRRWRYDRPRADADALGREKAMS